jgi:hypothetical protein
MRYYHPGLGLFVSRDVLSSDGEKRYGYFSPSPLLSIDQLRTQFEPIEADINLYAYCRGNPNVYVDPLGLDPATGPCFINIWMGDTLDGALHVTRFYEENTGSHAHQGNPAGIYRTPTVYVGVLGCGAFAPGGKASLLPAIPADQQIPGFPTGGGQAGILPYAELPKAVDDALNAAKALAAKLCKNRRCFIDNGSPKNYDILPGASNQRCDTVTLSINYTTQIAKVLERTVEGKELLKELIQLTKHRKKFSCLGQKNGA